MKELKQKIKKLVGYIRSSNFSTNYMFIGGVIILVMGIWFVSFLTSKPETPEDRPTQLPAWAADQPQLSSQIQNLDIALPYRSEYYSIFDTEEKDVYIVERAPYFSQDEVKPALAEFFTAHNKFKITVIWQDTREREEIEYGFISD